MKAFRNSLQTNVTTLNHRIGDQEISHTNLLFVCSMNQWRSPTAEQIYARRESIVARSCGTSQKARTHVRGELIRWADLIFVMEDKHLRRLKADFPGEMKFKTAYVLDIPDDYQFMDPELVHEIESAVDPILASRETR